MNIHLEHEIALGEDAFWKAFFDRGFNEQLYRHHLKFPEFEVVELVETEAEIRRRIKVLPNLDMPGAVQKVLGSSFRYTEDAVFDRKTRILRTKTTPSMLADKTKNESTLKLVPLGDDKVRRILDVIVEVKLFGLGGALEGTFEKAIRDGWNKSAAYMNAKVVELRAAAPAG